MEKTVTTSYTVLLAIPLIAALVCAAPLSTIVTPEDKPATRFYESLDPFLRDLPTLSQGDEPIGPHSDLEKKNSIGILARLNNPNDWLTSSLWSQTTTLPPSVILSNDTTIGNSSMLNVTSWSVTIHDYNTSTQVEIATTNTVQSENISNTVIFSQTTHFNATARPQTVAPTKTTTPVVNITIPPVTFSTSTLPPKMPESTYSSSIPLYSLSPVVTNGTSSPGHQRTRYHPIVFLLLPFLIAGGVALLILLGSYLRKKIRLDKLRHQLMPLYSFDPTEGEDWETELLTEPRASSQPTIPTNKTPTNNDPPKLRFAPDIEV